MSSTALRVQERRLTMSSIALLDLTRAPGYHGTLQYCVYQYTRVLEYRGTNFELEACQCARFSVTGCFVIQHVAVSIIRACV